MTIQYPDRMAQQVQETLPLRYRGILEVDLDIANVLSECDFSFGIRSQTFI